MNPENQAWQPLDPAAGSLPEEIESALGDGESVSACVVILVDAEIDRDWGAQASLAVARRWAASGRRVILADACLDGPVLHETAGVENGEGVSDMVLYGASAPRIMEPIEGGLMLAPAGTPVSEVADVLGHVKWDMVIRGCREAGATLVFHVSTGTPGVEAMTKRAEGVVVLAPPSKDVDAILGSESGPLIAVLGPANGDVPPVASEDSEGDVASVDVLPDDAPSDEAFSDDALPGLPEDEAEDDVPVDDAFETSDVLDVANLQGAQYDQVEEYGTVDLPEAESDTGQAPSSQPDEADPVETAAALDVESPASAEDPAQSTADVESAGADIPDVNADMQDVSADTADISDFGALALPELDAEDSLAEVGFEDAPAEIDPEAIPAGVGAEAAPAGVSAETAPTGLGVEASPTEERGQTVERKSRRGYAGLARLKRQKRREVFVRRMLIAVATSLVGGGGLFAIAYYGLIDIPGITPTDRVFSYVAPPAALPGPVPENAVMSHVLLIDRWFDIETPLSIADALRGQLPNLLFFVTPVDMDGRLQFLLYAGPAYSPSEAQALKEPIAVAMDRENPEDWSVHETPYAFYFGEYASAENAEGRVQALARTAIPAYSLQVVYADGTTRVRVYGGAFWDELEAERMGRMVNAADIGEMVLTSRRGTVPE